MKDKMIKACIFDLDGTIADTLESMAYVANEIMEKFSLKPQPADNFRYYSGEGADMLIRRCRCRRSGAGTLRRSQGTLSQEI